MLKCISPSEGDIVVFYIVIPAHTCPILRNENQNLNRIILCNMYGYNEDAPPISTTGLIFFLAMWYGMHLLVYTPV